MEMTQEQIQKPEKPARRSRKTTHAAETSAVTSALQVLEQAPAMIQHLFSDDNRKQVHLAYDRLTNIVDLTEDYSGEVANMIGDILAALRSIVADTAGLDTESRGLLRPAQRKWKELLQQELQQTKDVPR